MITFRLLHQIGVSIVVSATLGLTACTGKDTSEPPATGGTNPDTTAPVITLTGAASIDLVMGQIYTEQGAVCSDNIDASKPATVSGPAVVTTAPAVFVISYNCSDAAGNAAAQITRTVHVTATDITAPVITRTGSNPVNLYIGQTYAEQGAVCSDNVDASKAATVGGPTVVTTAVASFTVTYNCSDSAGNAAAQVTRTVNIAAYGLAQRPANTSCSVPDAPSSSSSFALTRVFPNLSFSSPVALRQSPTNADRWYVVEQGGVIRTFLSNDTSSTVFADLTNRVNTSGGEMGLLGMALHPNFATNGYVYVYYSGADLGTNSDHDSYISRFTITDEDTLNTSSELIILRIDQPYENHNGGNILFGSDGYLYIGMGDGGSGGDPQNNAQNINSLLGKMLRIDVNNTSTGKNYAIPADNPYAGATAGADEIFALGLRNPWRWSFDRGTNRLIAGDVGQDNWEEVDVITRGGNYGWRCYEGNHNYNTSGCAAQSTYTAPIHEYNHNTGYSITGGYVYRGSIGSLVGNYIFTDYGPGPIWTISDPFGTPVVRELINDSTTNATSISSFAEDAAGEIYVLRHSGNGIIYKITATVGTPNNNFPTLLSQTGCVNANNATQMDDGLIPYDINAPFWSDGAVKDRWFAIPDGAYITVESNGDWTFPNNSVLVKNFRINNALVETRLLVKHSNGSWGGYSYEWDDNQTDATFLNAGKTKLINGQNYIYPSSAQCMQCHTNSAGIALGPKTRQMNRSNTYASTGINANQIDTLNHIEMFSSTLASASSLPTLTVPTNTSASLHDRARAYLYTNCSQCHRPGGGTNVDIDFNITTSDANMRICNVASTYPGSVSTRMVPGNANASSIYRRMNCREGVGSCTLQDQMPPIGSTVVDTNGATLIAQWINSLSACPM